MLDDVFEEIAEDVKAVTDDDVIDSAGEMNAWLNSPESEYSPRKVPDNLVEHLYVVLVVVHHYIVQIVL